MSENYTDNIDMNTGRAWNGSIARRRCAPKMSVPSPSTLQRERSQTAGGTVHLSNIQVGRIASIDHRLDGGPVDLELVYPKLRVIGQTIEARGMLIRTCRHRWTEITIFINQNVEPCLRNQRQYRGGWASVQRRHHWVKAEGPDRQVIAI